MIDAAYILMIIALLVALESLFQKGYRWSYAALALLTAAVVLVVLSMRGY